MSDENFALITLISLALVAIELLASLLSLVFLDLKCVAFTLVLVELLASLLLVSTILVVD